MQFLALETVISRDIVDVHDESTVLFLQSGPARHPRLVWSSGLRALPFLSLLILNSYAYLRPLKMAGAHVFTNAHDFAITGGTFNTADTVSGAVRESTSKLMALVRLQIIIQEDDAMKT